MFKILKKIRLAENIYMMTIDAPRIANSAKPGQFLIVMVNEEGERVPLTIYDYDKTRGTVTIVFQVVGKSTEMLSRKKENGLIQHVAGPLGQPFELINKENQEVRKMKILYIAGGVGAAPIYPQIKWLKDRDVNVDIIIGSKTKDSIILKDELGKVSRKEYICTDDGSCGFKGFVTEKLQQLLKIRTYNYVVAIGPLIMMRAVCDITKKYNIKTVVSLNPIMVDGTGMCGACRVAINGGVKFACVDGPEFDGHQVDFKELITRQGMFKSQENKGSNKSMGCTCGRHNVV